MCICSTYCLQFRLEKSGIVFRMESGNPVHWKSRACHSFVHSQCCYIPKIFGNIFNLSSNETSSVDGRMNFPFDAECFGATRIYVNLCRPKDWLCTGQGWLDAYVWASLLWWQRYCRGTGTFVLWPTYCFKIFNVDCSVCSQFFFHVPSSM